MTEAKARPRRQEQEPASDEITEVAPGIMRMQLPIQLPGLGHVNCYALEDDDGFTVVDPGLPGPATFKALSKRLKQLGASVGDVRRVVVTHSHPDHFGGAGNLRHESGADIITHRSFRTWFNPSEEETADDSVDADGKVAEKPSSPWGKTVPWGGETFRPPMKRRLRYQLMRRVMSKFMRAPTPTIRLDDASVITLGRREWVAMHTPGHTPDHLCLFSPADGLCLCGDHVLPTITPHISGLAAGEDPLSEFFASLDRMAALEGVTLALPAHGHPFTDLAGRAMHIKEHHHERLEKLRSAALELGPAPVTALAHELFSPRSWGQMADSETYAHLEHLRHAGEATATWIDDQLIYELVKTD